MSNIKNNQTVAQAVRVEFKSETDEVFLVFQIVDEGFKKRIKEDWMKDVDLKLVGKNLVLDI